jgi:hypothetical protein
LPPEPPELPEPPEDPPQEERKSRAATAIIIDDMAETTEAFGMLNFDVMVVFSSFLFSLSLQAAGARSQITGYRAHFLTAGC